MSQKKMILNKLFVALVIFSYPHLCCAQNSQRTKFSGEEVKKDFSYLYATLEQSHYNLFVNTDKKKFDKIYQEIYRNINDSLTLLEITRLFQPFIALSKLAHCNINFPFNLYFESNNQTNAKLFPVVISVINKKAIVTGNFSTDSSIQVGAELLAIDNQPISVRLNKIYNFLSGESDEMKNTLIDLLSFPRIFWWQSGNKNEFEITYKRNDGVKKASIVGLKAAEFEKSLGKQKPVFNTNREFKILDNNVAYLRPGIFLNNESSGNTSEQNTFRNKEFISFIDAAFLKIYNAKSKNLIIDLRGNPGGDNSFSDPMIAYFATQPFWFCSEFNVKTSYITKQFWKDVTDSSLQELRNQILTRKDGDVFKVDFNKYPPRNDSLHYNGKVYILVDRYSYSNSVSVAAIVQDYHFGIIVGEPTADVASSYGAVHEISLPNTKIGVGYPKAFIVRPNGDKLLRGVSPDIKVSDNIYTDKDEILDTVLVDIIRN
jgi:C-terminal processing protease CtpA/Prc